MWFLCFICMIHATKDRERSTRKKPIAVTDPYHLRSVDDWFELGDTVLKKSCEAANLPQTGGLLAMATRLEAFYGSMRGKRGYLLFHRQ